MGGFERIAIVRLGAIGDVVTVLPFVCRLRDGWPSARISWVIGPKAHPLVAGHRAVDEFLVFDVERPRTWPAFVRALRARRFDLAIDLQRILKSGLVTRATGAPVRLGFDRARCKEASHLFTNRRIPPNPAPGVTVAQYLEFADFLGLPSQAPRWDLPQDPFPAAAPGELRVALAVGASWESKTWPLEHWVALARGLVRELGARVHVLGGREDRAIAEEIRARSGVELALHAGELSLRGTAGVLATAHALVSGDSGPMHMAVAVGTPVVALFGATDPARSAPFGQPQGVLRHPTPCSPCRLRTCDVAGHPCMAGITPEAVLARLRARLAEPPTDRLAAPPVRSEGDSSAAR